MVDLDERREAIISVKRNEDVSKGGAVFVNDKFRAHRSSRKTEAGRTDQSLVQRRPLRVSTEHFRFHRETETVAARRIRIDRRDSRPRAIGKKVKALELSGEWADVRDPEILAKLNAL